MYRTTVYLPIKLINKASDEGWLRSLAYLVRLKAIHKNGTFYKFSLRRVSEKVKCSPACLSFHLKVLEKHELVRYHAGNLTLVGLGKLLGKYDARRNAAIRVQHKNQYDLLRSLLIKFNLQQQSYKMRKHGKQLRNHIVPYTIEARANSGYTGLSCMGIGYLFGLKKSSGSRIRRKLEGLGVLKCERMYSIIHKNVDYFAFQQLRNNFLIPAWSFYKRGNVLVERRMKIECL